MLSKEQKAHPMIRSDVLYMIKRRAKGAALPLYLQRCDDFSKFGHGRPRLPEVFKTVSSDWVATLGQKRKGPHKSPGTKSPHRVRMGCDMHERLPLEQVAGSPVLVGHNFGLRLG
jgi:hypothetical protein